jgi:hypothetical protein
VSAKLNKIVVGLLGELIFTCSYDECKETYKHKDAEKHMIKHIKKCPLCNENGFLTKEKFR